ncbi:hypothetical protein [Pseudomonas sp. GL-RE-20]|uniref:hypothetical protein n=1 Tax=Pseudomonas sp. GL-RE-20 TaxID=2832372 RepID=UPI001CBC7550|nr:hypothetical protein [Pseudomonas sp. GL-RE-20]
MNGKWFDWYANCVKIALVALVVSGVYQWSAGASRKQEALCDVALSHVEALEARAPRSTELKGAKKAVSDACDRHDYYADD